MDKICTCNDESLGNKWITPLAFKNKSLVFTADHCGQIFKSQTQTPRDRNWGAGITSGGDFTFRDPEQHWDLSPFGHTEKDCPQFIRNVTEILKAGEEVILPFI